MLPLFIDLCFDKYKLIYGELMQAIILAGGLGSRLGTLVKNVPKPLLKVNNKPFVLKIVERLINQGIDNIIFCLGYKSQKLLNFFGDGSKWGISFSYVVENKLMGTAGAVRGAYEEISETNVFVLNGDSFCYFDIPKLLTQHVSSNADITLTVLKVDDPARYGVISFDKHRKVNKFIEKNMFNKNNANYINAGVYVIKKQLIKKIDKKNPISFEKDFIPNNLDKNIRAFILKNDKFIDIGTPNSYNNADAFFGVDNSYV